MDDKLRIMGRPPATCPKMSFNYEGAGLQMCVSTCAWRVEVDGGWTCAIAALAGGHRVLRPMDEEDGDE